MLAAEVDALRVHVLDPIPRVGLGLEDRVVVGGRDAGVVVEDVDAAVALGRRRVHRRDLSSSATSTAERERVAARQRDRLLGRLAVDVGGADLRALLGEDEAPRRGPSRRRRR